MPYVCVLHYNKKQMQFSWTKAVGPWTATFHVLLELFIPLIICLDFEILGSRAVWWNSVQVEVIRLQNDYVTYNFYTNHLGVSCGSCRMFKQKNSLKIKLPIFCGKTIWIYKSSIQLYFIKYDIGLNDINGRGGEHVYGQTSGYTHDGYASESRRNKCHKYVCKYYANNVCFWKISVLTYNHCPSWDLINNSIEFIKFGISTFPIGLTRKYLK